MRTQGRRLKEQLSGDHLGLRDKLDHLGLRDKLGICPGVLYLKQQEGRGV